MRGMRDPILSFLAVAAVALGLHFGLQSLQGDQKGDNAEDMATKAKSEAGPDSTTEDQKVAKASPDEAHGKSYKKSHGVKKGIGSGEKLFDHSMPKDLKADPKIKIHDEFYNDSFDGASKTKVSKARKPAAEKAAEKKVMVNQAPKASEVDRILNQDALSEATKEPIAIVKQVDRSKGGRCEPFEYPGISADGWEMNKRDWSKVETLFNDAKGSLLKWASNHKSKLGGGTSTVMLKRVKEARLYPPNHKLSEPDLAWRGIGVWRNHGDHVGIHLGVGFIELAVNEAQAARFEITRLLAQSWAPCELQRMSAASPWGKLLSCLDVKDKHHCEPRTNAESGWAVSTALAHKLSPRKCKMGVFSTVTEGACLKPIALGAARGVASRKGARK